MFKVERVGNHREEDFEGLTDEEIIERVWESGSAYLPQGISIESKRRINSLRSFLLTNKYLADLEIRLRELKEEIEKNPEVGVALRYYTSDAIPECARVFEECIGDYDSEEHKLQILLGIEQLGEYLKSQTYLWKIVPNLREGINKFSRLHSPYSDDIMGYDEHYVGVQHWKRCGLDKLWNSAITIPSSEQGDRKFHRLFDRLLNEPLDDELLAELFVGHPYIIQEIFNKNLILGKHTIKLLSSCYTEEQIATRIIETKAYKVDTRRGIEEHVNVGELIAFVVNTYPQNFMGAETFQTSNSFCIMKSCNVPKELMEEFTEDYINWNRGDRHLYDAGVDKNIVMGKIYDGLKCATGNTPLIADDDYRELNI